MYHNLIVTIDVMGKVKNRNARFESMKDGWRLRYKKPLKYSWSKDYAFSNERKELYLKLRTGRSKLVLRNRTTKTQKATIESMSVVSNRFASHKRHIIPHSDLSIWFSIASKPFDTIERPASAMRGYISNFFQLMKDKDLEDKWNTLCQKYQFKLNTSANNLIKPSMQVYFRKEFDFIFRKAEWHENNIFTGVASINTAIGNRFDAGPNAYETHGEEHISKLYALWFDACTALNLDPQPLQPIVLYSTRINERIVMQGASHAGSVDLKAAVGGLRRTDYYGLLSDGV